MRTAGRKSASARAALHTHKPTHPAPPPHTPVRHVAALELGKEAAAAGAAQALHRRDAALAHGRRVVAERELDALAHEFLRVVFFYLGGCLFIAVIITRLRTPSLPLTTPHRQAADAEVLHKALPADAALGLAHGAQHAGLAVVVAGRALCWCVWVVCA